jgi:uncharacterized RDD family membrane protein YckC
MTDYGAPQTSSTAGWSGPPLASWGQRVAAYLIDAVIAFGIIIVGFILGGLLGSANEALGGIVILLAYLGSFAFQIWNLVQQGNTGQTIGKKQMNLRLLRAQDGQPVGVGLSIGRYFLHIVDALPCYIGFLFPLWDEKRQTLADKIVDTVVVAA